jgi:hypothetical protein
MALDADLRKITLLRACLGFFDAVSSRVSAEMAHMSEWP